MQHLSELLSANGWAVTDSLFRGAVRTGRPSRATVEDAGLQKRNGALFGDELLYRGKTTEFWVVYDLDGKSPFVTRLKERVVFFALGILAVALGADLKAVNAGTCKPSQSGAGLCSGGSLKSGNGFLVSGVCLTVISLLWPAAYSVH